MNYPSLRLYDKLGVPYVVHDDDWRGPLWTGHCMMLDMSYGIKIDSTGRYHWYAVNTAYGATGGSCDTLAAAKVELAIGEADLFETPYPPTVIDIMRSDYERFAVDWPDPEIGVYQEATSKVGSQIQPISDLGSPDTADLPDHPETKGN